MWIRHLLAFSGVQFEPLWTQMTLAHFFRIALGQIITKDSANFIRIGVKNFGGCRGPDGGNDGTVYKIIKP